MMEPNIALIASLIGDQARSKMLTALMCGKALTATELALEADITAQTASSHLTKLVEGELLVVRKQGRHKYFQLKDHQVAELLEQLLTLSAAHSSATNSSTTNLSTSGASLKQSTGPADPRLRRSRICYDHLAGELGVKLYNALIQNDLMEDQANQPQLTEQGQHFFQELGVDLNKLQAKKRPVCKACLDWSERRSHLAGSLGQWILSDLIEKQWAKQDMNSRAIQFSEQGLKQFAKRYGL